MGHRVGRHVRGDLGSTIADAVVRTRRQARFVAADRYRDLLGGRYPALAAAAASTLDTGAALAAAARARRTRATDPATASLLAVTLIGDASRPELSIVVRGATGSRLYARRGAEVLALPTVTSEARTVLRAVAGIPEAVVNGEAWMIEIGDESGHEPVAAAGVRLAGPFGTDDDDGHLTLTLPASSGIAHTVEVGVRSVVITWPAAAGETLTVEPADGTPAVTVPGTTAAGTTTAGTVTAVLDLGLLTPRATEWSVLAGSTPLAQPSPPYPRLNLPAFRTRVTLAGTRVEIGYAEGNRLVVYTG